MPSLLEVQRGLRDALLAGAGAPPWIAGDGELAARRLQVVRDTIAATLSRALRLAYPTVDRLVGRAFFGQAAQVFAAAHPPESADLNAYGAAFPAFLAEFPPCAGLRYLPDVARLDRAVGRALHGADATPLEATALATVDPGRASALRLRFHPCIGLLRSAYPVDAIWTAVLHQDAAAMAAIDLESGPVHLLVERVDGRPSVSRMPPAHWAWTSALAQGRTLGELPDVMNAGELAAVLAAHLLAGRVVALQTDPFEKAMP